MPLLHKILNTMLMSCLFPDSWTKCLIVLHILHNKGDIDNVINFRGIIIVSFFYKLLTNVLNNGIEL